MSIKSISIKPIFWIIFAGFTIRIFLSFFGTLDLDFNTFVAWSNRLSQNGFSQFYSSWSDYLPGYLYVLYLLGKISQLITWIPQTLLYKLPAIISDVVTGYLVYRIVSGLKNEKIALIAASTYIFNPAVFANSSLWGQVDSLTSLFALLSVYFAGSNIYLSSLFLSVGTILKPQAAISLLAVMFIGLKNKWKFTKFIIYALFGLSLFVLMFLPFQDTGNIFLFVYSRILQTINQYPYTSVNAFNFWGFFGFWLPEGENIISASLVGYFLTLVLGLSAAKFVWKKKAGEYWVLLISLLSGFLFFSRMHERHLLPVLAPLAIVATISSDLWLIYVGLSLSYLANLYYSFIWITKDFTQVLSNFSIKMLILLNLTSLAFIIKRSLRQVKTGILDKPYSVVASWIKVFTQGKYIVFPESPISKKLARFLLFFVFAFSLFTRLLWLGQPEKEYFDEVYHAFTAQVMKNWDPKGWEWWNPHPEGFAYEWTHPPLAKEGMWLGMSIFGTNALGWRIPGALLGFGSVVLVYLISKNLFKDELVSIIAAAVFSFDGLPLVMSRIAMNDSYLLFFVLLSFLFYLKDNYLLSALFWAAALASKWSALWALPIFVFTHFMLRKKIKLSYFWFLIVPPLVYIASYIPMFMTNHGFDIFIGVQKQMWWYHTRLDATHPYTSMWYSWPLLVRPIWLYVGDVGNQVKNIYAMGNPAVFWFGIFSVFLSLYYFIKSKDTRLGLILFSYFVFFVPWAASPRIMFLYHYLPSIPFLSIAVAYVIRKNLNWLYPYLIITLLLFVYFYPHWIGLPVSRVFDQSYYWFPSWR